MFKLLWPQFVNVGLVAKEFFISDSFDSQSVINLIKIFKLKLGGFFFVMVNQKNLDEFDKFNPFKKIIFVDKNRNISFYKI